MKKIIISLFFAVCMSLSLFSQGRGNINIPDLQGFVTLKCDFHIHSVFSDGTVWPTVRIDEAFREGLDAISITDHIEYRPYIKEGSHNSAYEIAKPSANNRGVILIHGSEITRAMPPGHHNVIFITDADKFDTPNWIDALHAAKAQNAFFFWNHPCWEAQQPDTVVWFEEHTMMLQQGFMHGIEVVNGRQYCPEAHKWALEKNLTIIGTSDVHAPMRNFARGEHRSMTLVFARSRTAEAIHEALKERRTAIYFNDQIIGDQKYLKELFEKAIDVNVEKSGNTAQITIKNNSELSFLLKKYENSPPGLLVDSQDLKIEPQGTHTVTVRLQNNNTGGNIEFIVENFIVEPGKGMKYTFAM